MNCVPSWQVIWRSWYQWVPWIANLLKMTWWISKSMAFRRTFHNKTTGSSGVCCSFLFFGRKTKYMNILPWWIFLADYGQEHWKRKGWTWRMDISSSLHKAFLSFMLKGSLFHFVGGETSWESKICFGFFLFKMTCQAAFWKEKLLETQKKGEQRCSVFYGEFSWELPKNLQPHGKHLQLLNDLKFPASLETDFSGRRNRGGRRPPWTQKTRKMQLPFMPPPPKAEIFFSWIFFFHLDVEVCKQQEK